MRSWWIRKDEGIKSALKSEGDSGRGGLGYLMMDDLIIRLSYIHLLACQT